MMTRKGKYGLLFGLIVIATTIGLYAIAVDNLFKFPMAYITLFSLVLSQTIAMLAIVCIRNTYKSILTSMVFAAQSLLTLAFSLLYINIFPLSYVAFAVVYLITFVIATLATVLLYGLAAPSERASKELKAAKINMVGMRAIVNSLKNSAAGINYQKELGALDENLRFSDDSVVDGMDTTIYNQICELSARFEEADFDVKGAIDTINNTIKQRNFVVKNKKSYR